MLRSLSPEYKRFAVLLPELVRVVVYRDTGPDLDGRSRAAARRTARLGSRAG